MSAINEVFELIRENEKEARKRHEIIIVKIAVIEARIANCPNSIIIGEVKKDFDDHVNTERWMTWGKEIVKMICAGIAGLVGYKLGK